MKKQPPKSLMGGYIFKGPHEKGGKKKRVRKKGKKGGQNGKITSHLKNYEPSGRDSEKLHHPYNPVTSGGRRLKTQGRLGVANSESFRPIRNSNQMQKKKRFRGKLDQGLGKKDAGSTFQKQCWKAGGQKYGEKKTKFADYMTGMGD